MGARGTYRDCFDFGDSSRDLLEVLFGCDRVEIVVYDVSGIYTTLIILN